MIAAYAGHRDCVRKLLRPKPPQRGSSVLFDHRFGAPHHRKPPASVIAPPSPGADGSSRAASAAAAPDTPPGWEQAMEFRYKWSSWEAANEMTPVEYRRPPPTFLASAGAGSGAAR